MAARKTGSSIGVRARPRIVEAGGAQPGVRRAAGTRIEVAEQHDGQLGLGGPVDELLRLEELHLARGGGPADLQVRRDEADRAVPGARVDRRPAPAERELPVRREQRERVGERAGLDVRELQVLARQDRVAIGQPDGDPGRARELHVAVLDDGDPPVAEPARFQRGLQHREVVGGLPLARRTCPPDGRLLQGDQVRPGRHDLVGERRGPGGEVRALHGGERARHHLRERSQALRGGQRHVRGRQVGAQEEVARHHRQHRLDAIGIVACAIFVAWRRRRAAKQQPAWTGPQGSR